MATQDGQQQPTTPIDSTDIVPSSANTPYNGAPILTAFGGLTQMFSQYNAGKINSRIADYNANLARIQGAQAIQSGELSATQEAGRQRQREGNIAASYGAQGVTGGTAATTLQSSRNMSAMDRLMIETNARRQALGYQTRAATEEIQGKMASTAAKTGMLSTLLATGAQEELEQDPNNVGLRYQVQLH